MEKRDSGLDLLSFAHLVRSSRRWCRTDILVLIDLHLCCSSSGIRNASFASSLPGTRLNPKFLLLFRRCFLKQGLGSAPAPLIPLLSFAFISTTPIFAVGLGVGVVPPAMFATLVLRVPVAAAISTTAFLVLPAPPVVLGIVGGVVFGGCVATFALFG